MSNTEKSSGLWTRSHKITKLNVAGDLNEAGDASNSAQSLLGQVVYIRYMETIAGMCMVELTFVDTNGFLDALPIRSGMRLELEINHASREEDPFSFSGTKNNDLIVVNISGVKRDKNRMTHCLYSGVFCGATRAAKDSSPGSGRRPWSTGRSRSASSRRAPRCRA